VRGVFLFLCKFFCKTLPEFRFGRRANEIRNRGAARNYSCCGAYSNSLSLQTPLCGCGPPSAASPFLLFEPPDTKSLTRNSQ
jgi:hypothetical protein